MTSNYHEIFLRLVRLGIGNVNVDDNLDLNLNGGVSWQALENVANEQGLLGVMLDGVEKLPRELRPEKKAILQSIGQLIQSEQQYAVQEHAAAEMGLLLHQHGIRTYVLKGAVVAECYPRPEHRRSVDMDCFLVNDNLNDDSTGSSQVNDNQGSLRADYRRPQTRLGQTIEFDGSRCSFGSKSEENHSENLSTSKDSENSQLLTLNSQLDVWEKGNRVVEEAGFEVARGFYKNSTFHLPGLTVENHRFMTPFRGNRTLRRLEIWLQSQLKVDSLKFKDGSLDDNGKFEGTWLYRPPVMVSALFLIEHAYSHFLHEGLTWRHVLDWTMFSRRHREEIDWEAFDGLIDEYGFRKFYDSYCRLGRFLVGELTADGLTPADRRMLSDVWAPLDVHESLHGLKAKLQLAGNYWRARWKYKLFTDMTWLRALAEWVLGAVFDRQPRLG